MEKKEQPKSFKNFKSKLSDDQAAKKSPIPADKVDEPTPEDKVTAQQPAKKIDPPYKGPRNHPALKDGEDEKDPGGLTGKIMQMLKLSHMNNKNMTMTGEPMDKIVLNPDLKNEDMQRFVESFEQELRKGNL